MNVVVVIDARARLLRCVTARFLRPLLLVSSVLQAARLEVKLKNTSRGSRLRERFMRRDPREKRIEKAIDATPLVKPAARASIEIKPRSF